MKFLLYCDSLNSREIFIDFRDGRLQGLILLARQRDALLPRLRVHRLLVDVVLADVDVRLPLELPHLDRLHLAQVPGGLVFRAQGAPRGARGLRVVGPVSFLARRRVAVVGPRVGVVGRIFESLLFVFRHLSNSFSGFFVAEEKKLFLFVSQFSTLTESENLALNF